jgi:hypothetical protein
MNLKFLKIGLGAHEARSVAWTSAGYKGKGYIADGSALRHELAYQRNYLSVWYQSTHEIFILHGWASKSSSTCISVHTLEILSLVFPVLSNFSLQENQENRLRATTILSQKQPNSLVPSCCIL